MSDNIRVAIRVRPLKTEKTECNENVFWEVKDSQCIAEVPSGSNNFVFDRVFDGEKNNHDVYEDVCKPIVDSVIQGFNATVFAYGQTASGKTFTMMGKHGGIEKGIIHYAVEELFNMIQEMPDREFLLRVSVLEIYCEKVYDLLSDKNEDLKLWKDSYGVLNVKGLQEKIVQTSEQIMDLIIEGQKKRSTGETHMNRVSSRSHFIFRMILESSLKSQEDPVVNVSQLNFVDLAGSENCKQAKTTGNRLKEGIRINLSLSSLTQVINQLTDIKNQKADQFVQYRSSNLTRLLQNSLGGNSVTAIICTISPTSLGESRATLNFASRAKKIKNKPKKNEIFTDQALLKTYANEIKKLSEELKASKEQGKELEEKTKQNENLKKQIEALKANFVSHTVENKTKAIRRETWGGHFDRRHFATRNPPYYQLPNIFEEESEGDTESAEFLAESIKQRNARESSRLSTSVLSSAYNLKNTISIATQTDKEILEDNPEFKEAMILVSELKSHLTNLGHEFAELYEYTTFEKQILKAENELQVENENLKKENATLRKALESQSLSEKSDLSVSNESREKENDLSRSNISDSINKIDPKILNYADFSNKLNTSLNNQICTSVRKASGISKFDVSGSTLLDESLKSNFLAFYDECVESEASELKSEIESLKLDIEIKDKQLSLLNDKIFIKEQFITSLQDEIKLTKSISTPLQVEMKEKFVQADEICVADSTYHSPQKIILEQESQTSPLRETTCSNCFKLNTSILKPEYSSNIDSVAEKLIQTSPSKILFDKTDIFITKTDASSQISPAKMSSNVNIKYVVQNQFTQVTPIKTKELSTQCKNEITEQFVQTSPNKDGNLFSEYSLEENFKVDQSSQITQSFIEGCTENLVMIYKNKNSNEFVDQSSQTLQEFSETISEQNPPILDNSSVSDMLNSLEKVEVIDNVSDEIKILLNKIKKMKDSTINFMKNCVKAEYLKTADECVENVNGCSKSAYEEIIELENLIRALEYYITNRDQDCEIINNELTSKFQEIKLLDMKLSEIEGILNAKESELSNLHSLFFDMKQSFSQLTFVCLSLKNIDSHEKLAEIKELANVPVSPRSCVKEYEIILFKKEILKLHSYIEENASRIINLSEELKKVKSELSNVQRENDLKLFANSEVLKNTLSKSIQTSQIIETTSSVEKDKIISDLKHEMKTLQEQKCYLEKTNKDLKEEMDDLYSSHSERIEALNGDFAATWKVKAEMLVKDVEEKYDQELIDQENKFSQELCEKIQELKQENLKQVHDLNKEISRIKASHDEELDDVKKQYEDQLLLINSEKECLRDKLKTENEVKIKCLREKCNSKLSESQKVISNLKTRVQYYKEEIKQLKQENIPTNQFEATEKLKEKIIEISDVKDLLQKKCTLADQKISELKEHIKYLKHELKNTEGEIKQNALSKGKEIEELNKKLLFELDQQRAKIMSLESNNASLLQELKKVKEMLSSKAALSCKCKSMKSDASEKKEDVKSKTNSKSDLDVASQNPDTKKKMVECFETPKQNIYSINETPDQKDILCVGGGSGPANMVKSYWLEGIVHKKDKEITKLREEVAGLKHQLNTKKQTVVNEEKRSETKKVEVRKSEVSRSPVSPLQEVDENVTVQVKTLHPYHGGAVPKVPRKQILKEKNGSTGKKPYEKPHKNECIKNENVFNWQYPTSKSNTDRHHDPPSYKTKYDVVNQLADPECKQQ